MKETTAEFKTLCVFNSIGLVIFIILILFYREFDSTIPFTQQPHAAWLALIWLFSPRCLAIYFIFCAVPAVSHWLTITVVGIFLFPGAWGMYFLPGLDAEMGIRIFLMFVGFFVRDVIEHQIFMKRFDT
jgi:hypothetical protein